MTFRACLRWTAGLAVAALVAAGSPSLASSRAAATKNSLTSAAASATPGAQAGAVLGTINGQPRLIVDGKPFFFFGGAFFYPRIAPEHWRAQMVNMRYLGANTLDLYIPWNWHELSDGDFDFDGHSDARRNLREVLRLGAELGFHFIIRPGPVIRNEWRNGGYPQWLLTRPEYDMPLHDILEGRYPATATLQNARSDDAAAEWMQNTTHLTYSARWIARALQECRPYASRILAVQLDDDQGAYINNQTYPAPHLTAYLNLLDAQVHAALGPHMPTFINTYQMRVPSSSPVWTMGNWYQSDAYTIGEHDRVDLDFSTLLLALNRRGPLAQSEFQAGWLAGPEDPEPRPADPRNTALALSELLSLGVQGVIDFPLQDSFAEPGWEAPFSNALYAWDAALPFASPMEMFFSPRSGSRLSQTSALGTVALRLGPLLAQARRVPDVAVAYAHAPANSDSTPSADDASMVAAVRDTLAACTVHRLACDLIDEFTTPAQLRRYRFLILSPAIATGAPEVAARIRIAARSAHLPITATVGAAQGDSIVSLNSPLGNLRIAANWSDRSESVVFGHSRVTIQPHTVSMRIANLSLAAIGDSHIRGRITSDDCELQASREVVTDGAQTLILVPTTGPCIVSVDDAHPRVVRVDSDQVLSLPDLQIRYNVYVFSGSGHDAPLVHVSPHAQIGEPFDQTLSATSVSIERRISLPDAGATLFDIHNDRLRVLIDPDAGARAFVLQRLTPLYGRALGGTNAFDATGAFRDDVASPLPPSPRDYIARYTHGYPAGTFNRVYTADDLSTPTRASVRFRYTMPDALPANITFEKVVKLDAASSRIVIDERGVAPAAATTPQPIVVRSSLPLLFDLQPGMQIPGALVPVACAPTCMLASEQTSVAAYRDGEAFVVTWGAGDISSATWTPYRSTGTLALTMTPGVWHRTVYSYAAEPSLEAARAFAQAEREWVSANPPPSR